MTIRKKSSRRGKIIVDLTGPQGNAFWLLGTADGELKRLGYSKAKRDKILDDMKSSDYEHLIKVFDKHLGKYYILER